MIMTHEKLWNVIPLNNQNNSAPLRFKIQYGNHLKTTQVTFQENGIVRSIVKNVEVCMIMPNPIACLFV